MPRDARDLCDYAKPGVLALSVIGLFRVAVGARLHENSMAAEVSQLTTTDSPTLETDVQILTRIFTLRDTDNLIKLLELVLLPTRPEAHLIAHNMWWLYQVTRKSKPIVRAHEKVLERIFAEPSIPECVEMMRPILNKETIVGSGIAHGIWHCSRRLVESDEQALERILTDVDAAIPLGMLRRLCAQDTENGRLVSHRLLKSIYEDPGKGPHLDQLNEEERMYHMMQRNEWLLKQIKWLEGVYAGYQRNLEKCTKINEHAVKMQEWRRWQEALCHLDEAEEGSPATAQELAQELLAIMAPVPPQQEDPGHHARRSEYREEVAWRRRFYAGGETTGECVCCVAYQVPAACLTRFLAQLGSTRRRDGGSARTSAGWRRHQRSWGSRASRHGKAVRAWARSCSGSVSASDLTDMRTASRSRVVAMAWAVGVAGSCVAMKSAIVRAWSLGCARRASRVRTRECASSSLFSHAGISQSASSGMCMAARARTWSRPWLRQVARCRRRPARSGGSWRRMMEWATQRWYSRRLESVSGGER